MVAEGKAPGLVNIRKMEMKYQMITNRRMGKGIEHVFNNSLKLKDKF